MGVDWNDKSVQSYLSLLDDETGERVPILPLVQKIGCRTLPPRRIDEFAIGRV